MRRLRNYRPGMNCPLCSLPRTVRRGHAFSHASPTGACRRCHELVCSRHLTWHTQGNEWLCTACHELVTLPTAS